MNTGYTNHLSSRGITLVELLVAMAVLGLVLSLSSRLIFQNQDITTRQVLAGRVNEDVRQATLRMSDVISQAGYIFPNNATITVQTGVTNTAVVTGDDALAVLVPPRTAYCPLTTNQYCGFLYRLEPRDPYTADLGNTPGNSGWVLVEYQARGLTWNANTNPTSVANNWTSAGFKSRGVVADSVTDDGTNLSLLSFAGIASEIDRVLAIPTNTISVNLDSANALIGSVRVEVAIAYANGLRATRQTDILARGIPRAVPPGN
ncbi:PilW family protein [Meiothermus hypogaeus]|uniref:Prepilin-type N-terminal cleavage/methylation domain-containing protein n=2 Tax=Meiothermus hypogaeus TaxID=884155 RepID=A0A511R6P3_9DEIN|nr:type II secretion system protein [Meiothermus hypogaeus]RIH74988.1 hypothetical protein Mhypo_03106 [Meiothermus hypogaeus]GEM84907.1 hypothetical protein MHY01S_30730 [Meiothermus hypogaeus NBRC 106114]